ncbi:hypothetical protein [Cupriavidus nantongensis]|uniref:Uncharacterized protein n=1 Tax=Cupriavidus nantongensis TaxID=1796606 RepID=A0A142JKL1_9BURK|nr:hypothetical protein [Cupriavidus nantongensis]AMR78623.1 hypothetical protein A2G96_13205 [Cupriavidus nantongensis]
MSILNSFQEQTGARRQLPPTENFSMEVQGYKRDPKGEPFITGVRQDTGEEVCVYLRPYTGKTPLKAPRAEIKDFYAKPGEISSVIDSLPNDEVRKSVMKGYKAKTEPGGTIIVQRAFTDAEGMVQAGWLVSASKYAGHTVVHPSVMARVDPVIYRDNAPASATVTVINPAMAQLVKSAEQLEAAVMSAFGGNGNDVGGRNGVLIRLSDGQVSKAVEMLVPRVKSKDTDEYSDMPVDQAVARFLQSSTGKQISALVANPALQVEVMPLASLAMGSQTKAGYEQNGGKLDVVNRAYRLDRQDQGETGFAESYLVLHRLPNGAKVFTMAEPLSNKPQLFHARDVATANFAGHSVTAEARDLSEGTRQEAGFEEDEEFELQDVMLQTAAPAHTAPRMRM